jgi:hypothetical protein
MLEGRRFTVFTDHRPLVGALSRRSDPWLGRQQRHLSFIAEFSPTIRHITGQSNVVADTLSRPASGQSGAVSPLPPGNCWAAANSGGTQSAPLVAQPGASTPSPSGGSRVAAKGRAEVKAPSGSSAHTFAANILQAAAVSASAPPPSSPVDLAALAAAQLSCPLPAGFFLLCSQGDHHSDGQHIYNGGHIVGCFLPPSSSRFPPPYIRGDTQPGPSRNPGYQAPHRQPFCLA